MIKGMTEEEFEYIADGGEIEDKVPVIKKYLMTPEQKQGLKNRDLSIEAVLTGQYNRNCSDFVNEMLKDWNVRLGQKVYFTW